MGDTSVQFYMKDFIEALKPLGEKYRGKREIDQWLGKDKKENNKKGKDDKENVVYSLGGRRGKWLLEYCYRPWDQKAVWAYRDADGNVEEAEELLIDGLIERPQPPTDKMIVEGAALFPSGLARKKDGSVHRMTTKELVLATANEFRRD